MPFVEAKKFKSVNAYFSVCFQDYNDLKNEKIKISIVRKTNCIFEIFDSKMYVI